MRACLGGRERVPLAEMMAAGASDAEIAAGIRRALCEKRDRHRMREEAGALLPMIGSGG
jgi:hypothetical protein